MTDDLDALPTSELATIAARCAAILAARAGGVISAAPMVPVQLELLPSLPPIDPLTIDWNERLPPDGKKRWITLDTTAELLGCERDAALSKVKKHGAATQIGGPGSPWRIDRLRLASIIRTTFP
ncbi:hypothetical protein ATY77_26685 [Rhizobium sp. R634]|uniref:hypothetical protein n=1 Tax=Rhizobium sp. R634 TaxID=1764274 RepID=UPI000B5340EF|nr:hypothetical protein [Rhizobium sp. R634]OWV79577.1 hypothetical protein ATY77_26685 [Rhizobium sp. R634]